MIPILVVMTAAVASVAAIDPKHHRSRGADRHDFSPRMDYDEWTPLGRGDPLKNDPTYDYMPPVLDRVHYWVDPKKRTPDPPIVVSSVTTAAPTNTIAETSRLGTLTLLDPLFKLMDKTKSVLTGVGQSSNVFKTTPVSLYYPTPQHTSVSQVVHREQSVDYMPPPPAPPPLASQKIQALQRPPYTMLMPPPPLAPPHTMLHTSQRTTEEAITSFGTSTQTTSQVDDLSPVTESIDITTADNDVSTPIPNTQPPLTSTTIIANFENLYKPVAITMPESISNETSDHIEDTSTPLTTPDNTKALPIFSLFNEDTNHLQDEEIRQPSAVMIPPRVENYSGFLPTTVRTTTIQTLTTDAMFKHYKQPSKPSRGPFYLIIQGHSKVKTYGASKNKLTPVSMNEINFEDGRMSSYEVYDERSRNSRKLRIEDINEEVIEGHPTFELASKFHVHKKASWSVGNTNDTSNQLLVNTRNVSKNGTFRAKSDQPFVGRRLLATVATTEKAEVEKLDQDELGLESLIALNDDYNGEDIINMLLKQEGQGSGFGGFVASLFSRALSEKSDEI